MHKDRDETTVDPTQPALIVTYGNTSRKRRPLDKPVLVLGRMQGCDMPLMSPDVAPVHCILVRLQDGWHIRDCSGHLGTRVNGKSVTEQRLSDDDHLQVGPFNFKVYLPARRSTETPAPVALERRPHQSDSDQEEPTPEAVEKLQHSRTNLTRLALAYRNQAQAALSDQQELKTRLERQARELAAERKDLERDWKQLEKSAQAMRARELDLEHVEKALQERVGRLDDELARRQSVVAEELELEREKIGAQFEKLKREGELLDEDRADLDRVNAETERGQAELEELRARLEVDAVRVRTLLHDEDLRRQQLDEKERTLEQRARELDGYATNLLRERTELRDLANQPRPLDPAEREEFLQQIELRTARIAALDQENAALREQLGCVPTQSHILRIEDAALKQARDEARHQLAQLQLIADALQSENEELRKKLTTHDPADTAIGTQLPVNVPRADLEAAEAAYAALQMQVKRFQVERDQERSRSREELEGLRQEIEVLRQRPAPEPDLRSNGESEIADLREQVETLRNRLVELHAQQDAERQAWQEQLQSGNEQQAAEKPLASDDEMRQIVQQIDLLHQENEELRQEALKRQSREVETSNGARAVTLLEHQLQTLQSDLLVLQNQLRERDKSVAELQRQIAGSTDLRTLQSLRQAVQRLQAELEDRDALIEKLSVELDTPTAAANLQNSGGYERELHQFRLELERDRRILNEQLADVRQRQRDIEEATRETEVQLSRERATIARERNELNRLREEIRMDQERLTRLATKQPVAAVPSAGSLRDALNANKQEGEANGTGGTRRR